MKSKAFPVSVHTRRKNLLCLLSHPFAEKYEARISPLFNCALFGPWNSRNNGLCAERQCVYFPETEIIFNSKTRLRKTFLGNTNLCIQNLWIPLFCAFSFCSPHCRRLPDLLLSVLRRSCINTERDFESVHNLLNAYKCIQKTGRYRNAVVGGGGEKARELSVQSNIKQFSKCFPLKK